MINRLLSLVLLLAVSSARAQNFTPFEFVNGTTTARVVRVRFTDGSDVTSFVITNRANGNELWLDLAAGSGGAGGTTNRWLLNGGSALTNDTFDIVLDPLLTGTLSNFAGRAQLTIAPNGWTGGTVGGAMIDRGITTNYNFRGFSDSGSWTGMVFITSSPDANQFLAQTGWRTFPSGGGNTNIWWLDGMAAGTNDVLEITNASSSLVSITLTNFAGRMRAIVGLNSSILTNYQQSVTLNGTFSGNGSGLSVPWGSITGAPFFGMGSTNIFALGGVLMQTNDVLDVTNATPSLLTIGLDSNAGYARYIFTLNSGILTNNQQGVTLNGTFSGDGSGLSVPWTSVTGKPNVITNGQSGVSLNAGTFSGDGSGLTAIQWGYIQGVPGFGFGEIGRAHV